MQFPISAETLTAIFTGVIGVTGVFALLYARRQITEAHEQAQVQHLMSFVQKYDEEPMVSHRRVYAQKRLSGDEWPTEADILLGFFEMVALLEYRGYLKDTDIWEAFSQEIFPLYADARDWIEQERKDDPPEYSHLVSLVKRLEDIEEEHDGTTSSPSKEDIKGFWEAQVDTGLRSTKMRRRRSSKMARSHRA